MLDNTFWIILFKFLVIPYLLVRSSYSLQVKVRINTVKASTTVVLSPQSGEYSYQDDKIWRSCIRLGKTENSCEETQDHFRNFLWKIQIVCFIFMFHFHRVSHKHAQFLLLEPVIHQSSFPLHLHYILGIPASQITLPFTGSLYQSSPLFFFFLNEWMVGMQRDRWICLILKLHPKTLSQSWAQYFVLYQIIAVMKMKLWGLFSFYFFFYWGIIDVEHYVNFRCMTSWFDICMYCEMITTINLVNIHHHVWLQIFVLVMKLLRSTLLATFKCAT